MNNGNKMNQLKLLNYHKMIANFANNLVGAFISLIIFQTTGKLYLAVTYWVANHIIRLLITISLKNLYGKYPQLFLLIRIIPMILYNLFIFMLDVNIIAGIIGVCIFNALDTSLNNLSKEIIFNYSSLTQKDDNSSIGITRLFEQIGTIVALLIGGYLLDLNKTLVVILSIAIYGISVVPLVSFYIKSRKQKTFNKDATSNAITTLSKKDELKQESHQLAKKMLWTYFLVYFSFAFLDLLTSTYNMYVFQQLGQFTTAGILSAIFNCFYAIGFYVAGILNNKRDMTSLVSIACVLISICVIALPFIDVNKLFILVCVIYAIIPFAYTFISLFVLDRMLNKSRIMACSNKALFMRETGCVTAYVIGYSFGFIGLIAIFIAIGVTMFSSSFIIPICEEKSRQNLVDYLENNEKIHRKNQSRRKKKASASTEYK